MRIGGRVPVHDPHQAAGVGDDQVRVRVPFQESRQVLQTVAHPAANHHAAVGREVVRQQNLNFALVERGGNAHGERGNRKTALALVARFLVGFAGWIVEFLQLGVHEHRLVRNFPVVDLRTRDPDAGRVDLERSVLDAEHRQPVGGHLADLAHHHAVAVGVDERGVVPIGARLGQLADIQFARRDEHLAVLAGDGIPVHIGVVEGIVGAQGLALRDGVLEGQPCPTAGRCPAAGGYAPRRCTPRARPGSRFPWCSAPVRRRRASSECACRYRDVAAISRWASRRTRPPRAGPGRPPPATAAIQAAQIQRPSRTRTAAARQATISSHCRGSPTFKST